MDDLQRAYELLRLEPGASLDQVEEAYREAARHWHPNHFPPEPYVQEKARAKLREIETAYQQLKTHLLEADTGGPDRASPEAGEPDWRKVSGLLISPPGKPPSRAAAVRAWVREHAAALVIGLFLAAGLFLSPLIYSHLRGPSQPAPGPGKEKLATLPPPGSRVPPGEQAGPRTAPPSRGRAAPPVSGHYFTLGSSPDEVWAAQGPPKYISATTWKYGLSTVTFKNRRVIAYANISRNLRVRLTPKPRPPGAKPPVYFTIGSSKDRVLAVQGTPTMVVGDVWKYGESEVKFRDSRVVGYTDTARNLQVKGAKKTRKINRGIKKGRRSYFTLGSSKRRVLAVQGRPNSVWGDTWWYGYSRVDFHDDRVIGFVDISRNLKIRMF